MDIASPYFGYLSGLLITLSFFPYVTAILKGEARPERASWFLWSVLGGIAFFSQFAKGASWSLWLPGVQGLGDFLVFLFSIKYGMGGFSRRDRWVLSIAALALFLWFITREAAVALFLAILIDATGAGLTIVKSYEHPATEPMTAWVLTMFGGLFAVFAVGTWNWVLLVFPMYTFLANATIISSITLGKGKTIS